jgi:uncharacterized protein
MKILISGSSGFVGTALMNALTEAGHAVCRLVRPENSARSVANNGSDVTWNPATGELGRAAVGAEAVVHLAGASIVAGRWTPERKAVLRSSRVNTTRALVTAIAKMDPRPTVLVSASAIGYYGDRGDELLTEESGAGSDFLSSLAQEWEAEAAKAEALGIRVVRPRIGTILGRDGGILAKIIPLFKLGVGGRVGTGQQWMSWVTLTDTVGILRFALESGSVNGAVNVVAPGAVRNAQFTKELARAMRRPAFFPVPASALRLALGEMADALLLASQRVASQRLEKLGYRFLHVDLASALKSLQ